MPRVRRMTEEEAAALVTYVRELGRGAPVKIAGNAEAGRGVYQKLNCASLSCDRRARAACWDPS